MWQDDDEPKLKRLRHKPTGHAGTIPDHVHVDSGFQLLCNRSDYDAVLVRPPVSYFACKDLFESLCGPHNIDQW